MSALATPQRVLLVRLSAIGDVLMASGILPALRSAWPQARLSWLAEPGAAELLRGRTELDQLITWPKEDWIRLLRRGDMAGLLPRARDLALALRESRFDLVIDLQGLLKSGIWAALTGCRTRLGLGSREGSALLMTNVLRRLGGGAQMGSEYACLLRDLGLDDQLYAPRVFPGEAERIRARVLLHEHRVSGPYAVLCPHTTRAQKHWAPRRWQELAGRLQGDMGMSSVLLGADADQGLGPTEFAPARDLRGRTRIMEAAALIQGAVLVVGVDTGLTHMAVAEGVPTVALFGATLPYRRGAAHTRVLREALPCSPCRRRPTCGGRYSCMTSIDVGRVLAAARDVLAVAA